MLTKNTKAVSQPPSVAEAYDQVARFYDAQQNPLLSLETRFLERLLPSVTDKDFLDIGCGTGRWLERLSQRGARTVTGLDASIGMLEAAEQRKICGASLVQGECTEMPLRPRGFDIVLASFLLGYVDDVDGFAAEVTRVARHGCDLLIADMHPETQVTLAWKRTFHRADSTISIGSVAHRLLDMVSIFQDRGWEVESFVEPCFGLPEYSIFRDLGRINHFCQAEHHPAIYILHLRNQIPVRTDSARQNRVVLRNAKITIGPAETVQGSLQITHGKTTYLGANSFADAKPGLRDLDLSGYLLMPGLINAHDHLEFALFPRLANGCYRNASEWAQDIHGSFSALIAKHRSVPKPVRLWWGALRNLLCGVTTVCHHNPPERELFREDFPIRVVRNFNWAHSLAFDRDLRNGVTARNSQWPFILHAGEGVDAHARKEIWDLARLNVLDESCVIIHGLALDAEGRDLLRDRGTCLVLCPSSNHFLFGAVPQISDVDIAEHVALGSDSPLTAVGDLLDELRFAVKQCGLSAAIAYEMVTRNPSTILRLQNKEGTIIPRGVGDVIAVRDSGSDPAERLSTLSMADIELVVIGGRVHLASGALFERLSEFEQRGLEPLNIDGHIRWLRAPVSHLLDEAEKVLGAGSVRLGGKPVRRVSGAEAHHAN